MVVPLGLIVFTQQYPATIRPSANGGLMANEDSNYLCKNPVRDDLMVEAWYVSF